MRPYIFWPKPWKHYSGGARVLYYLCHYLNQAGAEAYMPYPHQVDWLNVPYLNGSRIEGMIRTGAIAIYPERVWGNPWRAETAVRLLLHEPGYFGGPTEFPGDRLYAFSRLISDLSWERILWVPTVETHLFNTQGAYRRQGGCYYVGKGEASRWPAAEGFLELSLENAPTREILAGILKTRQALYTYDDYTLLVWEARLCGCPVVVVPSHYTKEDYEASEIGLNGIAFSQAELPRARGTVALAAADYQRNVETFLQYRLPRFIEETQDG